MTTAQLLPGLEAGKRWWMCLKCGARKQVSERYKGSCMLRCVGDCSRTSQHEQVGFPSDYREDINLEQNAHLRVIAATEDMLDVLGIRLKRIPAAQTDYVFTFTCHRGRGKTTYFLNLADGLTVEEEIRCLREMWKYISPLNDHRWVDPDQWRPVSNDPQLMRLSLGCEEVPRA